MTRTEILRDEKGKVTSVRIDGRSLDEYVGRPVILCLYNNNQETLKAMTDTSNLIRDFSQAVDLVFSEHPDDKGLKLYYEDAMNVVGIFQSRLGNFSAAEALYHEMLRYLNMFESHGKTKLHKGKAFHNIAVSQFAQRNFDQSVANFLRASEEDIRDGADPRQIFALKVLQDRYIGPLVKDMSTTVAPVFQQMQGEALGDQVSHLLGCLEPGSSFLLLQTWKAIETNQPRDNVYSMCRALDNVRNVAWVAETFLKQSCMSTKNATVAAAYKELQKPTLREFLKCALGQAPWFANLQAKWQEWANFDGSNLPAEVDGKVNDLLDRKVFLDNRYGELIRGILLLGLVRNFTAHAFTPDSCLAGKVHESVVSHMLAVLLALSDELRKAAVL